jgi:hypothetical protein
MARSHSSKVKVEAFRNYIEGVAKKLADDLWGPQGPPWGTRLTEMEDIALEARDILTQKFLQVGLERQSQSLQEHAPAEATACPSCRQPFAEAAVPSPRNLQTRGGPVDWQEPHERCPRCRRAFFPSEPKSGH